MSASGRRSPAEPPRPELAVQRAGEELVLSWATVWKSYTLERNAALGSPAWEPVPGVADNTGRLPGPTAPAFFRLRLRQTGVAGG